MINTGNMSGDKKKVSARTNCAELQYATLRYAKETVGCRSSVFVAFKVPINAWPGFLASLFTDPAGLSSLSATHCVCLCLCECVWQGVRYSYPRQSTSKQRAKKNKNEHGWKGAWRMKLTALCGKPHINIVHKGTIFTSFFFILHSSRAASHKKTFFLTPTDLPEKSFSPLFAAFSAWSQDLDVKNVIKIVHFMFLHIIVIWLLLLFFFCSWHESPRCCCYLPLRNVSSLRLQPCPWLGSQPCFLVFL